MPPHQWFNLKNSKNIRKNAWKKILIYILNYNRGKHLYMLMRNHKVHE